jgi:hypothetical protein
MLRGRSYQQAIVSQRGSGNAAGPR